MLYDQFRHFLADQHIDLSGRALVGLSGGIDSVVLTDLVDRVSAGVTCLHVNYGLRGTASDEDEAFVRAFCSRRDLKLVVFDARREMGERGGESVQALAREIRFREYLAEAGRRGIDRVVLGHHADDQVETILLNLFRGAGLGGLAGMPPIRDTEEGSVQIVRPLLFARRAEIGDYARQRGLEWREDTSNEDPKYRRNMLRRSILPLLEEHFGEAVTDNILRMGNLARELLESVPSIGDRPASQESVLSIADLARLPTVVRTQIIVDTLARQIPDAPRSKSVADRIDALIEQQTGKKVELGGSAVIRDRGKLRFVRGPSGSDDSAESLEERVLTPGTAIRVPGGTLAAYRVAEAPESLDPGTPNITYMDAEVAGDTLTVTSWRDGDRIGLLGQAGTKKVSDLLTDAKISTTFRRQVPVVRSGDRIAWVTGVRLAADFAVTRSTKSVLVLVFVPDEPGAGHF